MLTAALQRMISDPPLIFFVSVAVLTLAVAFTSAVIFTVVRRSERRRAEEEKLAALGTATARILHQIKNPLQTIVLHADILNDERIVSQASQRREVCETIVGESQRLVDMLGELSEYASGKQKKITRQAVRLDDLLLRVAATEVRESGETGVRVDTSGIGEATVFADPYYIQQVFENLVRNAREAMQGQGDPRVAIRLARNGGSAEVRVADNGPGIAPDRLARVFDPFVSSKPKGMGLGLAICKEIVEVHQGTIRAESTPGQGTTFIVKLPFYSEAMAAQSTAA